MSKENYSLLCESVEHYNRMITWAENCAESKIYNFAESCGVKFPKSARYIAKIELKETWDTEGCALCRKFNSDWECDSMSECPLNLSGNNCLDDNSPYDKIVRAGNKQELIDALKNMRDVLQKLADEEAGK